MRKELLLLAIAAGMLFSALSPATGEPLKLRIGTEGTYKPMSFYDAAGNLTGFEVDLVNAICAKIKAECEFVVMDFDGMVPALQEKKIDAIAAGMRVTEKRKKIVAFADKYYTPYSRFVTCSRANQNDVGPSGMKGLVIGTQSGSTNADYLNAEYAQLATIRLYKTMDEVYLDLSSKRLDFALSNAFVGYDFLQSDNGKNCTFVGEQIVNSKYFGDGTALALRKGDEEIRNALNAGIKAIMDDGTYAAINAKYWPFSVR
jgi:polar amino acid transport system substrate-binding protein